MASARPDDYLQQAEQILRETPLIDGHNDFPFILRQQLKNQIYSHDFLNTPALTSHTDLRRMKKGLMGGQFWSVYVQNPRDLDHDTDIDDESRPHPPLNAPNWAVRDTMEQIDVTKRMVAHYPDDLQLCLDPAAVWKAHASGKIASMLGIEGGHQCGNSLATLRLYHEVGVRYMTLTHNSDNAFGTSWISADLEKGIDAGLSKYGEICVAEMNRLGMLVDLSHVSPNTMRKALEVSKAPVIFSHSGAYGATQHLRNAPDDVLLQLKQNRGVIMIPAVTVFLSDHPEQASIDDMVRHIFYVAELIGWDHVGLGSDFDGTVDIVKGLEDTTKWPDLVARVLARGATKEQARKLVGENVLRAWSEAEGVAKRMQDDGVLPYEENWEHRLWEPECYDVPRLYPKNVNGNGKA